MAPNGALLIEAIRVLCQNPCFDLCICGDESHYEYERTILRSKTR